MLAAVIDQSTSDPAMDSGRGSVEGAGEEEEEGVAPEEEEKEIEDGEITSEDEDDDVDIKGASHSGKRGVVDPW